MNLSTTKPPHFPPQTSRRGFALLITITLLAFLVLLLVSLASLTRVETQVASNNQQLAQARQNALAALNIALRQLQKYAGPDQRITSPASFALNAPASQTSDPQKGLAAPVAGAQQWVGVWGNSSAANDIYAATPKPVLLNWLISGNEQAPTPTVAADGQITSPTVAATPTYRPNLPVTNLTAASTATDTTIRVNNRPAMLLVGPRTAGTNATAPNRYVAAPLVDLASTIVPGLDGTSVIVGRYAYWIGDEGVKAQYNLRDGYTATDAANSAEARYRLRTPARNAIELLTGNGSYPVNNACLDNITDKNQFRLADSGLTDLAQQNSVHDLTTVSWGVLANSQSGGLRSDLSHALQQPVMGASFANKTIIPDVTLGSGATQAAPLQGPKWETLKSFADLTTAAWQSTPVEVRPATATVAGISPVIVQSRLSFAVDTLPTFYNAPGPAARRFYILVYPAFVISNPYSFPIRASQGVDFSYAITTGTSTEWGIGLNIRDANRNILPATAPFNRSKPAGGPTYYPLLVNKIAFNDADVNARSVLGGVRFQTPGFILQPGEIKTYTLATNISSAPTSTGDSLALVEGVNVNHYKYDTGEDVAPHPTIGTPANSIRFGYFLFPLTGEAMTLQMALHDSPASDGSLPQPQQGALQCLINADLSVRNGPATAANPQSPSSNGAFPYTPPPRPYTYSVIYPNINLPYSFGGYCTSLALPILDTSFYKDNAANSITWIGTHRPYADYNLTARNFALPPVSPLLTDLNAGTSLETIPPYTRRYLLGPHTPDSGQSQGLDTAKFQDGIGPSHWGFTTGTSGSSKVILYDAPKRATADEASLFTIGQLQHADLTGDDNYLSVSYQPRYAVGNSLYNPYVLRSTAVDSRNRLSPQPNGVAASGTVRMFDLSYLMNTALWDGCFFSSLRQSGADVGKPANQRIAFASSHTPTSAELGIGMGDTLVPDLSGNGTQLLPEKAAARYMMIKGALNINSTSVSAWRALLAGGRSLALNGDSTGTPFARSLSQSLTSANADDGQDAATYAGYRRLTDTQITTLATNIVAEIRKRGPFVSLAHFVNRAIGSTADPLTAKGALQAAIDASALNPFASTPETADMRPTTAYAANGEANLGNRNTGAPGWLTQADILQSIGSTLSARSDTFTIRVYADVINPLDQTAPPVTRVWCEATVQRFPDYVDSTVSAAAAPTAANQKFGRKFRVISFRWLTASDI
jgi:hypothetical protein